MVGKNKESHLMNKGTRFFKSKSRQTCYIIVKINISKYTDMDIRTYMGL